MPDAGLTLPPGADPTVIDIAPDAFSERLTLMSTDSIPADVFATIAPADRDRALLRAGNVVEGPAIVTEMDSTTLVLPGHAATVHPSGSLLIRPLASNQEG